MTSIGERGSLLCTVSTVLDTVENVQRFVERNLAAGIDHMFVFLDGSDPDVEALLGDNEHVTAVRTGKDYWQGRRPPKLNPRQTINANLVNCLLAPIPNVKWLFHIDGDECLDVDKNALLAVEDSVPCVRLQVREAVSQRHWDGDVAYFKDPLPAADLSLLTILGVIDGPHNRNYFNGHLNGKVGVRPNVDVRLAVHRAYDVDGQEIEALVSDRLHVLHYESFSGEEFVRKWAAHRSNIAPANFKARRDQLREAIEAILTNKAIDGARKIELLMEVYKRRVEDDLDALQELGYLVTPSTEHHHHVPSTFSRLEARSVAKLLERLLVADKRYFDSRQDGRHPRTLLDQVISEVGLTDLALERRWTRWRR